MRLLRRNTDPFLLAVQAGQITPGWIQGRLNELKIALDDAVYFHYPEEQVREIENKIKVLEGSLEAAIAFWDHGVKERAAEHAAAIKVSSSLKSFDEATKPERLALEIERLLTRREMLKRDVYEAVRLRDPQSEIDRLAKEVADTTREIMELRADLARFGPQKPPAQSAWTSDSKRRNPRRGAFIDGVRLDLKSGKLSAQDVSNRMAHFRRILAETIANDPEARERIAALTSHIKSLSAALREGRR